MAASGVHASIECSSQPMDISFHPSRSGLLAAALVDGTIEVHDFDYLLDAGNNAKKDDDEDDEQDTIVSSTVVHRQLLPAKDDSSAAKLASARAISFSADGRTFFTGGSGGDLACLDAERLCTFSASQSSKGAVTWRIPDASYQRDPIQVIHELPVASSHSLMATGDEAGGVRLWDPRLCNSHGDNNSASTTTATRRPDGCVQSWKVHDDYVSGIEHTSDGNTLVASSADCTLSVYDLRMASQTQNREKIVRRSDDQEDELLSVTIMKNGRKVVAGTGEGVLNVWSWGIWGDLSDRFPGHPASVDALLKVDEDTLLTGSSDGLIRVVSIHPDKVLGILGDHDGFPIEKLKFNSDKKLVGSVTHDNVIRLWDASLLQERDDESDDEEEEDAKADSKMDFGSFGGTAAAASATAKADGSDDEWEDMDEEMSVEEKDSGDDDKGGDADSDDSGSDDEDDDKDTTNDKRAKLFENTDNAQFFADL